jgi:alpha-1,4-digalacturonate transport system substrate-binding protein
MIDRTGHRFWGPSLGMCADYFADDGSIQVDSPGFRATAEMLRRWHVNGWMPGTVWDDSNGSVPAERYFVDGQAAFYIGGSWQVSTFERDIGDNFDWVVVPNPTGGTIGDCDGRSGMPGGQVLTAVTYEGQSEVQKRAVGALMSYLTQPENLQHFYEESLFLPSYGALQDDELNLNYPAGEVQLNTFRNEIAELDEQAYRLQYHPHSDHIRFQIRVALVNYIQGRMSLDQAIESASQHIDQALSNEVEEAGNESAG